MKCEKCNNREATFFYSSTVDGETTERHLCADCAREEGLYKGLEEQFNMGSMLGSMFSGVFSPFGGYMPAFAMPAMMMFPAAPGVAAPAPERSEVSIPQDAGEDIRARRELTALKAQLDAAVRAENFEGAIELRDRIKSLENH